MILVIIIFLLLTELSQGRCIECHPKHTATHVKRCTLCHVIVKGSSDVHKHMVKDPGNLEAPVICGGCHKNVVRLVKKSPMATAAGIIALVRYQWGAQKTPEPIYATRKTEKLKQIPPFERSGRLVDDFLRKKCLRCHLYAKDKNRSLGCGACHMDPTLHRFINRPTTERCLSCHRFNRTGQDYVGLYERDYHRVYYEFSNDPYHHLLPDVHYEKGLSCVDCHSFKELFTQEEKASCTRCHRYSKKIYAHRIAGHQKIRCSACHALWSFQDYGLHTIREDDPDWYEWKDLIFQSDPQIPELAKEESNSMRDWIDGKRKTGVWFIGWGLRIWEDPPLAKDKEGRVCVVRPDNRFHISWKNTSEKVLIDNEIKKGVIHCYTPHTIRRKARSCYSCHNNPKVWGQGFTVTLTNGTVEYILVNADAMLSTYIYLQCNLLKITRGGLK